MWFFEQFASPLEVRVMRDKSSGASRGFAFIDFATVADATALVDGPKRGVYNFRNTKIQLEYSRSNASAREGEAVAHGGAARVTAPIPKADWLCPACGTNNFAYRVECFSCRAAKPSQEVLEATLAAVATDCVIINGLDAGASEEAILAFLAQVAPVKELRLPKDKGTHHNRGFAFADFFSIGDATRVKELVNGTSMSGSRTILRVTYSVAPLKIGRDKKVNEVAHAAIAAAEFAAQYSHNVSWTPKEFGASSVPSRERSDTGTLEDGETTAGLGGYVFDAASGYYKDETTGMFYDATTGLFYDSHRTAWLRWDQSAAQYVAVAAEAEDTTLAATGAAAGAADAHDTHAQAVSVSAKAKPRAAAVIGSVAVIDEDALIVKTWLKEKEIKQQLLKQKKLDEQQAAANRARDATTHPAASPVAVAPPCGARASARTGSTWWRSSSTACAEGRSTKKPMR